MHMVRRVAAVLSVMLIAGACGQTPGMRSGSDGANVAIASSQVFSAFAIKQVPFSEAPLGDKVSIRLADPPTNVIVTYSAQLGAATQFEFSLLVNGSRCLPYGPFQADNTSSRSNAATIQWVVMANALKAGTNTFEVCGKAIIGNHPALAARTLTVTKGN